MMNWKRIALGGLIAGFLLNALEGFAGVVLGLNDQYTAAFTRLGLTLPQGGAASAIGIAAVFVMGFYLVWLYAALRPRFGPGVRTAIVTAFAAWLPFHALIGVFVVELGFYPLKLALEAHGFGLVEFVVCTLVGAALYREGPTTRASERVTAAAAS